MRKRFPTSFGIILAVFAAGEACVGEEPGPGGNVADAGNETSAVESGGPDAPVDAGTSDGGPKKCSVTRPFANVAVIDSLLTPAPGNRMQLSPDELTAVFQSSPAGTSSIYLAKRTSLSAPFGSRTQIGPNSAGAPTISTDQLTVIYTANGDLERITRNDVNGQFGGPTVLTVNSAANEGGAHLTAKSLYFSSRRLPDGGSGTAHLYRADFAAGVATTAFELSELETTVGESDPTPNDEETVMYFRSGTSIYVSTRTGGTGPWGAPTTVSELGDPSDEPAWLSADLCRLYFISSRTGTTQPYLAVRSPEP